MALPDIRGSRAWPNLSRLPSLLSLWGAVGGAGVPTSAPSTCRLYLCLWRTLCDRADGLCPAAARPDSCPALRGDGAMLAGCFSALAPSSAGALVGNPLGVGRLRLLLSSGRRVANNTRGGRDGQS